MSQRQRRRFTHSLACWLVVGIVGLTGCASLGGSGTYNKAWSPQEKCRAVHLWVTKFWSELPPKHPDGTKPTLMYYENLSINLFKDEYFVPMFGTPFDQMSDKDRQVLGNDVERCFTMLGRYKDWEDLNRYYRAVMPNWKGEGRDFARHARDTKQWHDRVLAELRSAPPNEETFKIFLHAKAHSKRAMERYLPAEQQVFNEALEREGRPVAEAVLIARIDKASAVASTYEGVKQLQAVFRDMLGPFDFLSPTVKAREAARAAQVHEAGLTKLLEEEWKRFEARGTKVTAVKKGVLWYHNLEDRYILPFDVDQPIEAILKRFREAREKDLAESTTFILEDLKVNATTIDTWELKRQEYLVDEDDLVKAAKPIHAWFEHQKAVLEFQKEKWRFSENEIALMKEPGFVTVPSSYGPPSEDDIRKALLRAYVSAGGSLVKRDTATISSASFDDLLGTIGRGGLPRLTVGTVSIGTVRIEACSEGKGASYAGSRYENSKGYVCRYIVKGQVNSDQFMLTREGWLSPTADDRILENRNRATTKFLEEVGKAAPKPGCWGLKASLMPACQK